MKNVYKTILRRGAMLLMLIAFCITGSYIFSHRHAEAALPAEAKAAAPVIVLDAGHGAST